MEYTEHQLKYIRDFSRALAANFFKQTLCQTIFKEKPMGKIAPHEGRELELVYAGVKPLATIDYDKDPEEYNRAFSLRWSGRITIVRQSSLPTIISITLKENKELHEVYRLLSGTKASVLVKTKAEKHRLLGRLFGYSEEDIDEFLSKDMECACGQCKWEDTTNG